MVFEITCKCGKSFKMKDRSRAIGKKCFVCARVLVQDNTSRPQRLHGSAGATSSQAPEGPGSRRPYTTQDEITRHRREQERVLEEQRLNRSLGVFMCGVALLCVTVVLGFFFIGYGIAFLYGKSVEAGGVPDAPEALVGLQRLPDKIRVYNERTLSFSVIPWEMPDAIPVQFHQFEHVEEHCKKLAERISVDGKTTTASNADDLNPPWGEGAIDYTHLNPRKTFTPHLTVNKKRDLGDFVGKHTGEFINVSLEQSYIYAEYGGPPTPFKDEYYANKRKNFRVTLRLFVCTPEQRQNADTVDTVRKNPQRRSAMFGCGIACLITAGGGGVLIALGIFLNPGTNKAKKRQVKKPNNLSEHKLVSAPSQPDAAPSNHNPLWTADDPTLWIPQELWEKAGELAVSRSAEELLSGYQNCLKAREFWDAAALAAANKDPEADDLVRVGIALYEHAINDLQGESGDRTHYVRLAIKWFDAAESVLSGLADFHCLRGAACLSLAQFESDRGQFKRAQIELMRAANIQPDCQTHRDNLAIVDLVRQQLGLPNDDVRLDDFDETQGFPRPVNAALSAPDASENDASSSVPVLAEVVGGEAEAGAVRVSRTTRTSGTRKTKDHARRPFFAVSRRKVIVSLLVIGLLSFLVYPAIQGVRDMREGTSTANKFFQDLSNGRIHEAYERTSLDFRADNDEQAFRDFLSLLGINKLISWEVDYETDGSRQDGDLDVQTRKVRIHHNDVGPTELRMTLAREENVWRVRMLGPLPRKTYVNADKAPRSPNSAESDGVSGDDANHDAGGVPKQSAKQAGEETAVPPEEPAENAQSEEDGGSGTGKAAARLSELVESPFPTRVWTDDQSRTIRARFSGFGNGKVGMEKENGQVYWFDIEKLSLADRQYVVERIVADAVSTETEEIDLKATMRKWTDRNGRQVEAIVLAVEGDVARFLRIDGEIFRLALSRLSDVDQELIDRHFDTE